MNASKRKSTKQTVRERTHSRYWMDFDTFESAYHRPTQSGDRLTFSEERENFTVRAMKLATIRRAVANFVNIVTSRNDISVTYSAGNESYTDGKKIVIAADDKPEHFDSMVGLALHESAHILLSDFNFLRNTIGKTLTCNDKERVSLAKAYMYPPIYDALERESQALHFSLSPELGESIATALGHIKTLMNILEDRRIDTWMYRNASGYRPYYDAMYKRYFYTDEMGRNLRYNPEWRTPTVENYMNRLLLAFHPDADLDALPGLRQLVKMMDLPNIARLAPEYLGDSNVQYDVGTYTKLDASLNVQYLVACSGYPNGGGVSYENTPALFRCASEIYARIMQFVERATKQQRSEPNGADVQLPSRMESNFDGTNETGIDLPDLDGMPTDFSPVPPEESRGKVKKFDPTKAARELREAKSALDGDVKKKKATVEERKTAEAFEKAEGELMTVNPGGDLPEVGCMVLRKVEASMIGQQWFPFARGWNDTRLTAAISAGRRMGAILAHRLQVRNDPHVSQQTRLDAGRMDRRLLAQLGMEITNVFQRTRVDMHRPAMLHLSLDASGSMVGAKWHKTVAVSVALAYAAKRIRNLDVVVSYRGGSEVPVVAVVHDSRRDTFESFVKIVKAMYPGGGTPESLCYEATLDILTECADTHDTYLINFSDGEPAFYVDEGAVGASRKLRKSAGVARRGGSFSGKIAIAHAKKVLREMRDRSVKVLSYFIEEEKFPDNKAKKIFKDMYGESASFVNVQNASEVLRTMNKLLIART